MTFRYDPARPPPSVGGPLLTSKSGPQDNRELEARDDVLVFTSRPLAEPVNVLGKVTAAATVSVDTGQADLFARLCLVDPEGRSTNICDGLVRLDLPAGTIREITIPMSSTAYRIPAGHRIRLQLSGGANPRFDRHRAGPSRISVHHPTALVI